MIKAFKESIEQAERASTIEQYRDVLADIAERAHVAGSAAAVDAIYQIAYCAAYGVPLYSKE